MRNSIEDISYGIKKWQKNWLHWFILTLGFALFGVVLSAVLQIGAVIFEDRPIWVNNDKPLLTVGKKNISGQLIATTISELEQLPQTSFSQAFTYFGFDTSEFSIDGKQFKHELALFDPHMAAILQLPASFERDATAAENGVVISHQFWQQQLGGQDDIVGQVIDIGPYHLKLPIKAVAPASMNTIGRHIPAFWLPVGYFSELITISLGDGSSNDSAMAAAMKGFRTSMAKKIPSFYGVVVNKSSAPINLLSQEFEQLKSNERSTLHTTTKGLTTYFTQGIELNPTVKANIILQWYLLLILACSLGIICILNLLTVSFSRLISRSQEFNVRVAVGAKKAHILLQLLLESVPMMIATMILMFVLTLYANGLMADSVLFADYFVAQSMAINNATILWCGVVIIAIIAACSALPLLNLLQKQKMIRSNGRTKVQKLLDNLNMTAIFGSALVIITLTTGLAIHTIAQQVKPNVATHITSAQFKNNNSQKIHVESLYGQLAAPVKSQLAYANSRFVQPKNERRLVNSDDINRPAIAMNIMAVSKNYFDIINVPTSHNMALGPNDVILNQAAIEQLGLIDTFNGAMITIEDKAQKYRVVNSVANLPHFGVNDANVPMVYLLFEINSTYRQSFFLFDPQHDNNVGTALAAIASKEGLIYSKIGQLGWLIDQVDHNQKILTLFTMGLCLILVAITSLGILYQMQTFLFFEKKSLGLRLAIGHEGSQVIGVIAKSAVLPLLLAIPIWLVVINGLSARVHAFFAATIFTVEAMALAFCLTLIILLLAAVQPTRNLFNTSIKVLLSKAP